MHAACQAPEHDPQPVSRHHISSVLAEHRKSLQAKLLTVAPSSTPLAALTGERRTLGALRAKDMERGRREPR